jgi:hypothetical protein
VVEHYRVYRPLHVKTLLSCVFMKLTMQPDHVASPVAARHRILSTHCHFSVRSMQSPLIKKIRNIQQYMRCCSSRDAHIYGMQRYLFCRILQCRTQHVLKVDFIHFSNTMVHHVVAEVTVGCKVFSHYVLLDGSNRHTGQRASHWLRGFFSLAGSEPCVGRASPIDCQRTLLICKKQICTYPQRKVQVIVL